MNRTVLIKVELEDNNFQRLKEAFEKVEATIQEHNSEGYKVISVTALTSSGSYYDDKENQSYGYGYSFTSGLLIVFEEINQ